MATCVGCGEAYVKTGNNQKYCTKECKGRAYYLLKTGTIFDLSEDERERVRGRLMREVVELESGCHAWIGARTFGGHGIFTLDNRSWKAHRVAYELVKGPIPKGVWVLHDCHVGWCVNPDHLHLGDHQMEEKMAAGRQAKGQDI